MSKFIAVVECAIEFEGKFLIIKRPKGKHAENLLAFPGGKVEITDANGSGDVLQLAVKREVFEEMGLELQESLRYVTSSYFIDSTIQQHVIDVIFHCEIKNAPTNLKVSKEEVADHGWMTYDEIIKADNCPEWLVRYLDKIIPSNLDQRDLHMSKSQLPDFIPSIEILPNGPVSKAFLQLGIKTFYDAVSWVYKLPYGRNSDRAEYMLIFDELRGTCSTKHAALAELAKECGLPVSLKMVICKLDEKLDPKVKPLLVKLGVEYLPEAHCYLSTPKGDFDITFPNQPPYPKVEVLEERIISSNEIGDTKLAIHQNYLKEWISCIDIGFDELWRLREEWIRLLSN